MGSNPKQALIVVDVQNDDGDRAIDEMRAAGAEIVEEQSTGAGGRSR